MYVCAQSLSRVWLFVAPWTVAHQAPLPMESSRILNLGAISYRRGSSWLRDRPCVSASPALAGGLFAINVSWEGVYSIEAF